jgi:hypothetical protein
MQKAHPTFTFAHRSSLREASRAGRFSKRWHLSRLPLPVFRPLPSGAIAGFGRKASAGRKTN